MLKALAKDIFIYGIAGGVGRSIQFLLVPFLTRIFSSAEYGVIDLISSLMALFTILGMMQLESSVGRYYYSLETDSARRKYISTGFITIIGILTIIVVSFLILSTSISELLFGTRQYSSAITYAGFVVLSSSGFYFLMTLIRYIKKPLIYAIVFLVQMTLSVGLSLAFIYIFHFGIEGYFAGQMIGFFVGLFILVIVLIRKNLLLVYWEKNILYTLFQYSLPLMPGLVAGWSNVYLNRFVMLNFLSVAEVGIFAAAIKIASALKLLEEAIKMSWLPFVYENLKAPNHKELFRRIFTIIGDIVFMLISTLILLGEELIKIILPEQYYEAIPLTYILFISFGLTLLVQIVAIGTGITKRTKYNSYITVISLIINIGMLIILVPMVGLEGVAYSLLISTFFAFIMFWHFTEKFYPINFAKIRFMISLLVTLAVFLIVNFIDPSIYIKLFLVMTLLLFFLLKYKKVIQNTYNTLINKVKK